MNRVWTLLNTSWFRQGTIVFTIVLLFLGTVILVYRNAQQNEVLRQTDPQALERYRQQIRERPFDGSLLLRSARHHYRYTRYFLSQGDSSPRQLRPVIEHALQQYRRLDAHQDWTLRPRDEFFSAYLYYQLGTEYNPRANRMARRAHADGHRSPELIALLGNIRFRAGEYEQALSHYRSLGETSRDPVVAYNQAMALRELKQYDRARSLLQRSLERLSSRSNPGTPAMMRELTLGLVRISLDEKRYDRALEQIRSVPPGARTPRVKTLEARALLGLGRMSEARRLLQQVTREDRAPPEAELLLEKLSREQSDSKADQTNA